MSPNISKKDKLLRLIENLDGVSVMRSPSEVTVTCCSFIQCDYVNSKRNSNFLTRLENHLKSYGHQKLVHGGWSLLGKGSADDPWKIKRPLKIESSLSDVAKTKRARVTTSEQETTSAQEDSMPSMEVGSPALSFSSSSLDSPTNTASSQTDADEVTYRTCTTAESAAQTEPVHEVADVLSDILGISVTVHNISVLRGYPYVIAMLKNLVRREPSPGKHNTKAHEPVLVATSGKLGLKYNLGVVNVLNHLTGGPGPSTVKKVIQPGVPVLDFYDESNITEHLTVAKGKISTFGLNFIASLIRTYCNV